MNATLRAGNYERVSDDQDGRSRSVSQQGTADQAAADQHGWRVVATYSEPDRSASRFARKDRPEWDRLLRDVAAGRLDVVVLWEPSRGDRRLTGWSTFLDLCRAQDVKVHITQHHHTYDLSSARDWKSLAEDGIDSAYESEKASMRIRRDMADAAARGIPHGRLAYGYVRRYDPLTRALLAQEPHPEQAPVVREIITRIAAGEAVSALVADLTARGVRTPTGRPRWARSTITRMVLDGTCYISKRRHNGGPLLDGTWPALVDEDVYWRAVAVLQDPARKKAADGRGGILPGRSRWLLSYVATCAVCGAGLGVTHRVRGGERVPMYRCSSSRGGCAYAPVGWMDGIVADSIVRRMAEPERWEPEGQDREAAAAQDEAAAERERLAAFERQAIAGEISAASFARLTRGIEARIATLEARARTSAVDVMGGVLTARTGEHWDVAARRLDILERWDSMPLPAQRRTVRKVCEVALEPASGNTTNPERVQITWREATVSALAG